MPCCQCRKPRAPIKAAACAVHPACVRDGTDIERDVIADIPRAPTSRPRTFMSVRAMRIRRPLRRRLRCRAIAPLLLMLSRCGHASPPVELSRMVERQWPSRGITEAPASCPASPSMVVGVATAATLDNGPKGAPWQQTTVARAVTTAAPVPCRRRCGQSGSDDANWNATGGGGREGRGCREEEAASSFVRRRDGPVVLGERKRERRETQITI